MKLVRLSYLKPGDIAVITPITFTVFANTLPTTRATVTLDWNPNSAGKGQYKHYMIKEIHEQPIALADLMRSCIRSNSLQLPLLGIGTEQMKLFKTLHIVACGTALHAAMVGKYFLQSWAKINVAVTPASEWSGSAPIIDPAVDLLIALTQSGATADTLAAIEYANQHNLPTMAIVNTPNSQAVNITDGQIMLLAGPEISVASTKAFTSMVIAQALFALQLAQVRETMSQSDIAAYIKETQSLPGKIVQILVNASECETAARLFKGQPSALYLGRGVNWPIAMEGALKLKEISYIHAEGYPAGEMKHGSIALIDDHFPVVAIAPSGDPNFGNMLSAIQQVKARGAKTIVITTHGSYGLSLHTDCEIVIPSTLPLLSPVLVNVVLQLIAYYVAVQRGLDVDQPRNLAKSVTVE